MNGEICKIDISRGGLDNDYTFFENGTIRNFYDQNNYKLNIERWVQVNDISDGEKIRLLENCPEENKEQIRKILFH